MPAWASYADRRPLLAAIDSGLRGIGQVLFMNNPITGLLILVALLLTDIQLGVLALVGLIASTLAAHILRLDRGRLRSGLFGYNGFLVGAGLAALLLPRWSAVLFLAVIAGGAASTVVMVAMSAVLKVFALPALTFPFNVVTIPILWSTFAGTRLTHVPGLAVRALTTPVDPVLRALQSSGGGHGAAPLANALLRGVGQVFLADSAVAGAVILLAVGICSPIAMTMALAGSAIGALMGIALGASGADIYHGLWGFNSFLTAVAIGGVFLVPTSRSVTYAAAGAAATAVLYGGLAAIFAQWGVSSLTLAFCLTTSAFLLISGATPLFRAVPLSETTTPERHRSRDEGQLPR